MDLKSGCMLWPQFYDPPALQTESLTRDERSDVVVVGGGISGAFLAYFLTLHGIETILVDRRSIGAGSTAASTGLLQYELDTSLLELACKIGHDWAGVAYRASLDALRAFGPLLADLSDNCGYSSRTSLYLAHEEREIEALRAECDARKSIGIDVSFLDRERLGAEYGIRRPAALLSAEAGQVDPYHLSYQLIQRAMRRGLRVFTETEIARYEHDEYDAHGGGKVILHARNQARIGAKTVVFATGYETTEFCRPGLTTLASTYAFASEPVAGLGLWRGRALIWETTRPYLYARTTPDGRVLVGGADVDVIDPARRDALIPRKVSELAHGFAALFPGIEIVPRCAWSGVFAWTADGLPYIGSVPQFPNGLFALGYGGNGITFSLLAARMIASQWLGHPSPLAELFSFDR